VNDRQAGACHFSVALATALKHSKNVRLIFSLRKGEFQYLTILGNSAADSAAKDALLLPVSNLTVPHSDYKSLICLQALRQWQLRWNCETENKLHSIALRVNVINMFHLPCRDEIIIHRLRIEHTYLTHGHKLRGETPPRCLACEVDLTVEHVVFPLQMLVINFDVLL